MNSLQQLISRESLNEVAVMNGLTDAGLISDLCVTVADVASKDCFRALQWVAGTWRFEKTTANPFTTQNVRLEHGSCVIVLQEFGKDQE